MTFELSTPVKIAVLSGLVLMLAVGGFASYAVATRHSQSVDVISTPTHAKVVRAHAPGKSGATSPATVNSLGVKSAKAKPARAVVDGNLPSPIHRALLSSREVVAVLTAPGVQGDAAAVQEARAGARAAHVGFAVVDVTRETVATTLAPWAPNAGDRSVLVVRRPGSIVAEFDGYADREMVAQAALDAR